MLELEQLITKTAEANKSSGFVAIVSADGAARDYISVHDRDKVDREVDAYTAKSSVMMRRAQ